jgi:hypothetical protein
MNTIPPKKGDNESGQNDLYIVVVKLDAKLQNLNQLVAHLSTNVDELLDESQQTLIRLKVVESRLSEADWWFKNAPIILMMAIPVLLSLFSFFVSLKGQENGEGLQKAIDELRLELKEQKGK